ncbi:glutamate racemase [Pleionea sp. CnH1-48]|uniref:glutamate racemase n=1 Tax=Pleionea sp. CnH1-48 TaxID=2954494 RepID=UPI0020970930|nr:glutamate racemase [Pleionea sp. CnH1-48]MCO7227067.1 glutamate racemase [Pleionea sp. CnH1-48]
MKQHQILIMDSGIGGLTVFNAIREKLPEVVCHYIADHAYFPYGTKTEKVLEKRMKELLRWALDKHQLDAVVIACNSASTAVLDELRAEFAIPFIGVVPAIKTAAELTQKKSIGLLATEGTVNRQYTEQLIQDFARDCKVTRVASSDLVHLAEEKIQGKLSTLEPLREIVSPLIAAKVDVVVLGCTHFPWFREELKHIAPDIQWIDSGEAIARRVEFILADLTTDEATKEATFYSTKKGVTNPFIERFFNIETLSID